MRTGLTLPSVPGAASGWFSSQSGLEIAAQTKEHMWDAELLRLQGECILNTVDSSQSTVEGENSAEERFRHALDIARLQEARSFELRAATSLARLLRDEGRGNEALGVLTPIYDWFTEGFDTKDLRDAKALRDELEKEGTS